MSSKKVAIIDYGMGNLHSVASAIEQVASVSGLDIEVMVTSEAAQVEQADHVIFPGVGAIRDCIAEIKRLGFDKAVAKAIDAGKPVLGICVGMQSLMQMSEENGGVECLRTFPGNVRFFSSNEAFQEANAVSRLKVPHMGWNQVIQKGGHPLWENIPQASRFYFVHSYYIDVDDAGLMAGESEYGIPFTAAIAKDNVFAVQFHPEKSHTHGLQLLENFIKWDGKTV